jgi:hypothetical protein
MEVTMKLKGKFGVIMVALAFILASACIALAGSGMDQQTGQATVSGSNQKVNSSGAMRVDQDFGNRHKHDANQFGDDRAYSAEKSGVGRDSDKVLKWHPTTYGLGGDYGRDVR